MPGDAPRFGVTTPRAAGNAVHRNRFKRLLREAYRRNRDKLPAPGSILVIVRRTADEAGISDELFELVHSAWQRSMKSRRRSVE